MLGGEETVEREHDVRTNAVEDASDGSFHGSNRDPEVTLDLRSNEIGSVGARALAQWPGLSRLRVLDLNGNQVGDEGAMALARSPYLRRLISLDLCGNGIGEAGVQALRQSRSFPRLTNLYLGGNPGDQGS